MSLHVACLTAAIRQLETLGRFVLYCHFPHVGEAGGGATPPVDATLRFVEEFVSKEKELPSTQQPPLRAEIGKPGEDEGEKKKKKKKVVDSFEPTYMYE